MENPLLLQTVAPCKLTPYLRDLISAAAEMSPDALLSSVIREAYTEAYGTAPTQDQLAYLLSRVQDSVEANQTSESDDKKGKSKPKRSKSLGTTAMQWLEGLSMNQLLMLLSDFNPTTLNTLYTDTDVKVITAMAELYVSKFDKHLLSMYEAVLYGFGGSYGEEQGQATNETPVDLGTPEGMATLASFFKKHNGGA